jgi:hypothetical protein
MDYSVIIYFLALYFRITITFEYNDDNDDEKQMGSQTCKYYFMFNYLIPPFSSYHHSQVRYFQ